jgi:hypothetical protein
MMSHRLSRIDQRVISKIKPSGAIRTVFYGQNPKHAAIYGGFALQPLRGFGTLQPESAAIRRRDVLGAKA